LPFAGSRPEADRFGAPTLGNRNPVPALENARYISFKMRERLKPRILLLCPLDEEWSLLVRALAPSNSVDHVTDLKTAAAYFTEWRTLIATSGHGKTQCGVQTQYLIGRFPSVEIVACVGAAGSLVSDLSVGDVVVGTETVEHDSRLLFASRPPPCFPSHSPSIPVLRRAAGRIHGFRVAFGVIASGDEDVVASERARAIRDQTGAICVAWEGSGAARAALFNGIGSLEIRGVTDAANKEAPQRFEVNLPIAMTNLAALLRTWLAPGRTGIRESAQ
jgi:adenosylhomocysteine nucleosidase